jgi:hypothetical protein
MSGDQWRSLIPGSSDAGLTARIRSEANIADRPGQLDRLSKIADEVDDALMAQARLTEDQRDRIAQLQLSLRICASERQELTALREDWADLRAKVEALHPDWEGTKEDVLWLIDEAGA